MKSYLYQDLYDLEGKHWWHISKRRITQSLIRNCNKTKSPKILDVGCGTGKNAEQLQKYGQVWGLDNSLEAIKFCKKRGLKNLKLGNAEKTNFKSESFDIITLLDVLEHTDDEKTLTEMGRILKKDGIIIISVPALSWLWSEWDKILYHKRRYNLKSLAAVLGNNGFKIVKIFYLYSFLIIPVIIIRKIKEILLNKKNYSSDFLLTNLLLNKILSLISMMEFKLAQRVSIPVGTTIFAVAKK